MTRAMTQTQLTRYIHMLKGERSWREFAASLGVHFTDLHAAGQGKPPKAAILRALGLQKQTETRYAQQA